MRDSIFIQLATLLIKADIYREDSAWKRRVKRSQNNPPWNDAYLLKDIGLSQQSSDTVENERPSFTVERRVRHLRRLIRTRIPT